MTTGGSVPPFYDSERRSGSMPKFEVTAEFVDRSTGERVQPGAIIEIPVNRVDEYKRKRIIGKEIATKKPPAHSKKTGEGDRHVKT